MIRELLMRDDTLYIAHRGASAECPENTLPAFVRAAELGADMIELDVRLTGDGGVVVLHDPTVDRTTDGSGLIADMRLSDLRKLDAGSWFDARFRGTLIPTLDEVFATVPNMCLNIELKTSPVAHTRQLIRRVLGAIYRHNARDRVLLSSFDHAALAEIRRFDRDIALGVLFTGRLLEPIQLAERLGAQSLHPDIEHLDPLFVAEAKAHHLAVYAWTAKDEMAVNRALACRVSGIILDDLRLRQTVTKAVPSPTPPSA
ncbi:glycerophosphodiester phosphodiesterase [Alicyclobacillus acidocaldarius]|uniref:Glycerophosphoryl diester phosphodiesterase n=1 Tax=Alicyclobacillus acidocaldarius (strain Tc-4-1) TaxID=1048834 RepID=F8IIB3_ALIAT|nr:glycerophosphodiester phosphodiesterase family protein [Alicyclobacillus acidocaldarius]AEJ42072.1 glycerophosphoryl diester phosphodiesterase [Alicyclobacillus acidocaldarius subsp. acidocaldarius Tc-4-1]